MKYPALSPGIGYMILAAFFFSIMAAFVKASGSHLPFMEIVFARSVIVFLITFIWLRKHRIPVLGNRKGLLFLRGLVGFFGLTAFYYTLTHIPIADSVMLQYSSPLFTALLATVVLKEKSSARLWGLYLLAFLGVAFIVRPGFSVQAGPALVGVLGAFSAGLAYNLVRYLRNWEHPMTIVLSLPLVSILLSFPFVVRNFVMPTGWDWVFLLGVGVATQIAQVFLTKGLVAEKAAVATNVIYVNVVFSALWGVLFWGEVPSALSIAGGVLVVVAIVLINHYRQDAAA